MAPPTDRPFEHFEHDADIGVRGFGATLEQAFENAALALVAVIVDPARVRPLSRVSIELSGADRELLLSDWLNAIVFEIATRRMLFSRFSVRFDGAVLHGEAWGEPIDRDRHAPAVEIKGATLTGLRVEPRADGFVAQCILDV